MRRHVPLFLAGVLLVQACGALKEDPPPPPVPPRDVRAEWGDGIVTLTWSAAPDADHYRVYRAAACAGPWERRVSTSERAYIDSEVQNGETYFFAVSTVDGKKEGGLSIEVRGEPGIAPPAPAGLVALEGDARVDLSWTPVTGATRYRIERADAIGGPFRRVAYTTQPSFSSTGLAPTEQHFRVRALAGSAEGPESAIVTITPLAENASEDPSFVQAHGFDGIVSIIVPVDDDSGDVYVAGSFAHYGTSETAAITRMRVDGSPDPFFSPPPLDTVYDIVRTVDGSGDLFVAESLDGIVRLDADGSVDGSFDADLAPGDIVTKLAPARDGSGAVYALGQFLISGYGSLKRLKASGEIDVSFAPELPFGFAATALLAAEDGTLWVSGPNTVRLDPFGRLVETISDGSTGGTIASLAFVDEGCADVYAGGPFPNGSVQRLRASGGAHEGFTPPPILFTSVTGLTPAGDEFGEIYVSGFTGPASPPSPLVRYDADGALDEDFPTGKEFAYYVTTLATAGGESRSPDVIAGGWFVGYEGTGVDHFARINADGTLHPGTRRGAGLGGHAVGIASRLAPAIDGSGDLFVSGTFSYYDGQLAASLMRVAPDGSRNGAFTPPIAATGSPASFAIAPAQDGSGDLYTTIDVFRSNLVRLEPDGSPDPQFAPRYFGNGGVATLAPLPTGSLWVGGGFDTVDGEPAPRIARLLPSGMTDPSFDAGSGFDLVVGVMVPASDGSGDVYVGGSFTTYDGLPNAKRIVRLNADGAIDTGFVTGTGFDDEVMWIADAGDGTGDVYVAGAFSSYRGAAVPSVVRLRPDGTREPGFAAATTYTVNAVVPALDGSGDVWIAEGVSVRRLDPDGGDDAGFDSGEGFGGATVGVGDIALSALLDSSGRLVAGGAFTSYRGATVDGLVRIAADGSID